MPYELIALGQIAVQVDDTRIRFEDVLLQLVHAVASSLVEVVHRPQTELETQRKQDHVCELLVRVDQSVKGPARVSVSAQCVFGDRMHRCSLDHLVRQRQDKVCRSRIVLAVVAVTAHRRLGSVCASVRVDAIAQASCARRGRVGEAR
jgi:hypothetical protein